MNNHNTWTSKIDGVARQTKPEPYVLSDWLQEAIITVTDKDGESSSSAIRVVPQGEGISYNHENDTTKASATYMIINESGVELPYTGGIGTTLFYILGMVLSLGAGVVLVLKAKKGRSLN